MVGNQYVFTVSRQPTTLRLCSIDAQDFARYYRLQLLLAQERWRSLLSLLHVLFAYSPPRFRNSRPTRGLLIASYQASHHSPTPTDLPSLIARYVH